MRRREHNLPARCACTTGFTATTACMGYDSESQSLTTSSVIGNLVAGCSGKGYQLPSIACANSGAFHDLFRTWLKGIVRLQWNSSTGVITREADLITLPCGM